MTTATQQLSQPAVDVARMFVAAFEALKELGKHSALEQKAVADTAYRHFMNAYPMSVATLPDPELSNG